MLELPRHAEIWLLPYVVDRVRRRIARTLVRRVWVAICDHYEPFWRGADETLATERVSTWRRQWPAIATRIIDSTGRCPKYSFFYAQEEYRPDLLAQLADMVHSGFADVEVHIHHDRQGRQNFIDRISTFIETLVQRHGLLRQYEGKIRFGFIHGDWALDNSLPKGIHCGLNDEISILRDLGCYADFTMPSGNSYSQSRTVNRLYWAIDDPNAPKSYDRGVPASRGGGVCGDLLMIAGPLGLAFSGRMLPRLETGELAGYALPTESRVRSWLDLAPTIGEDLFLKLFSHGSQERNSVALLSGALEFTYRALAAESSRRGCSLYFVSAWEMYCAIQRICSGVSPLVNGTPASCTHIPDHSTQHCERHDSLLSTTTRA